MLFCIDFPVPPSTNALGSGGKPLAQAPGDGAQRDPVKELSKELEVKGWLDVAQSLERGNFSRLLPGVLWAV